MIGRRITPDVIYNQKNISVEIEDFIDSISFTDNLSGQADDISISLGDRERRWITKQWRPKQGASLNVALLMSPGWGEDKPTARNLGAFEIDELSINGPPTKISIKGTSIPASSSLRGEKKSKAWEKTNLKKIAGDIAKNNKLGLHFSADENPAYDRIDQESQSDIAFLNKLCSDAGVALKIAHKKIIILDEVKLESEAAVMGISRTDSKLKDYGGKDSLGTAYKACKVSYTDIKSKKTISYTFTPKNPPSTARVLVLNEQVTSKDAAVALAKKSLRNANKEAASFSLRMAGFLLLCAGQCINLKDFGTFDGKYLITSVSGSVGAGSETSLELRKCLEGY
jgi:phage protein D